MGWEEAKRSELVAYNTYNTLNRNTKDKNSFGADDVVKDNF